MQNRINVSILLKSFEIFLQKDLDKLTEEISFLFVCLFGHTTVSKKLEHPYSRVYKMNQLYLLGNT